VLKDQLLDSAVKAERFQRSSQQAERLKRWYLNPPRTAEEFADAQKAYNEWVTYGYHYGAQEMTTEPSPAIVERNRQAWPDPSAMVNAYAARAGVAGRGGRFKSSANHLDALLGDMAARKAATEKRAAEAKQQLEIK